MRSINTFKAEAIIGVIFSSFPINSSIVTFSQKTFNSRLFSEAPYSLRVRMTSTSGSQLMDHRRRGRCQVGAVIPAPLKAI